MPNKNPKNQDSLINNEESNNNLVEDFNFADLYPEVTFFETINPMHYIKKNVNNVNNEVPQKLN